MRPASPGRDNEEGAGLQDRRHHRGHFQEADGAPSSGHLRALMDAPATTSSLCAAAGISDGLQDSVMKFVFVEGPVEIWDEEEAEAEGVASNDSY